MPFEFTPLSLPGVVLVQPRVFSDARGFVLETYRRHEFATAGLTEIFVQENHSSSNKGTLRGLHFQRPPMAQGKLVRVLAGEIYDVAVDLRKGEPTFGKWVGVTLSARDHQSLYVPAWCAHGFCVLSERADVLYKMTAEYAPALESGIAWDDPSIGITWPVNDPILSARDRAWPSLATAVAEVVRSHAD